MKIYFKFICKFFMPGCNRSYLKSQFYAFVALNIRFFDGNENFSLQEELESVCHMAVSNLIAVFLVLKSKGLNFIRVMEI